MRILKYYKRAVFAVGFSLLFLLSATFQVSAQELSMEKLLTGLQSTSSEMSVGQKNDYITMRVRQLGVDFVLNAANERKLRAAGASDSLIRTIKEINAKTLVPTVNKSNSSPQYISLINQGLENLDKGNYDAALANYKKAISIKPEDPENHFYCGVIYYLQADFVKALAYMKKATELDPKFANAFNNLGLVYRRTEDYQLAIRAFNRSIELDSQNSSAYNNRGLAYLDLKEFELAIDDYSKAIAIEPDATIYVNRAYVYKILGEFDLALADCNRALKLKPQYADGFFGRGNIYRDLKDYKRAIAEYDRAISLNPRKAQFYINRGAVYYILKNPELAIQNWRKALELNPDSESARNNLNIVLREQNKDYY